VRKAERGQIGLGAAQRKYVSVSLCSFQRVTYALGLKTGATGHG